jgi:hypothetical protein
VKNFPEKDTNFPKSFSFRDGSRSRRSSSYSTTHYYNQGPNQAPNSNNTNNNDNNLNDSEEYSTLRKLPFFPSTIEQKRYSTPIYAFEKFETKNNKNSRQNETVEVLADQVIEPEAVSFTC